jgi:hypothetical protein
MKGRLRKLLAQAGYGSRRGRVNGNRMPVNYLSVLVLTQPNI